jgi:DNA-binding NarL/FixJ family response regulator
MDRTIRLLLVGPHQLHLDCLATALTATGRFLAIHRAISLEEATRVLTASRPDLLLIDAKVARRPEHTWAAPWSRNGTEVRVLVLGAVEEESAILGWIESGADGVHLKERPLEDLLRNIEHLLQGEVVCPPELFPFPFRAPRGPRQGFGPHGRPRLRKPDAEGAGDPPDAHRVPQ